MAIEDALAAWLVNQRWFAGKGQELRDLAIVADTELLAGDPGLRHLIVAVSHGTAVDYYQVLIGLRRRLPARLRHARIGPSGDGRQVYDALHDADLTKTLLAGIAADAETGTLRMHAIPGAQFDTGLDSLVLGAEQSNTSLVYGEESILKVFRRLSPGPNPDLEVTTALARLGSPQVAEPLGWIETRLEGVPTSLGILSRYLRLATDGWTLAATSVRDLYAAVGDANDRDQNEMGAGERSGRVWAADAGGDFAGESRRLGIATAQVHADLAAAFGTEQLSKNQLEDLAGQLTAKLDEAVAAVPELAVHAARIRASYADLARLTMPVTVQRIHGDYHLGQVMRTDEDWVALDFEGEPLVPLAQRTALYPALRDVAGMLRSFDYAARHQLMAHPDAQRLRGPADAWVASCQQAFCAGYARAGGLDPATHSVLLRALLLEKAVYETRYEASHRPSGLPIPLDYIAAA
jgi:maltokinase